MTSKRYERRMGEVELKPWEKKLVEQVNHYPENARLPDPTKWLECMVCHRKSEDVIPREITGLKPRRQGRVAKPQMDICCNCTGDIRIKGVDITPLFIYAYELTGEEIGVRNMDRGLPEDESLNSKRLTLEKVAKPVEPDNPFRMLRKQLEGRS